MKSPSIKTLWFVLFGAGIMGIAVVIFGLLILIWIAPDWLSSGLDNAIPGISSSHPFPKPSGQSPTTRQPAGISNFKIQVYLPIIGKSNANPSITLTYRSGQTFITWQEQLDLQDEVYRVYRSNQPITQETLAQARLLGQVGRDSARFYANRFLEKTTNPPSTWTWTYRFVDRYVIQKFGDQLPLGTGLFVWTLPPEDFNGASSGKGYYAVTVTSYGGKEFFDPAYSAGTVKEVIADPEPVEIHSATSIALSPNSHIFIQYMNLRDWNPTFHPPNATNDYDGISPSAPGVVDDLQYAYDYVITVPDLGVCGGKLPARLPVILSLYGSHENTYWNNAQDAYSNNFCAYVIMPQDEGDTWYFGFAQYHDYRQNSVVDAGDTIVNYTEQRILRMIYDLIREPIGPAVDPQRIYVVGQSIGGSGALAFAERYPNVFAAAYASQLMTNFLASGVTRQDWVADLSVKWGTPALNLPVSILAPGHWAGPLQKYNGIGVWDWQNYQENASARKIPDRLYDNMAPFGVNFGTGDDVITWLTQGAPGLSAFNSGFRTWGAMINADSHEWQYYEGLPPDLAPLPYHEKDNHSWTPFWNLSVIRDETIPGFSNLSDNSTAASGGYFNQTVLWSSSWNAWDGAPVDQANLWQMSLCPVAIWSLRCGTGPDQTLDVTPRRVQHFLIKPGARYDWHNQRISDGAIVASGDVSADRGGLLIIRDFQVSGTGNRLIIRSVAP